MEAITFCLYGLILTYPEGLEHSVPLLPQKVIQNIKRNWILASSAGGTTWHSSVSGGRRREIMENWSGQWQRLYSLRYNLLSPCNNLHSKCSSPRIPLFVNQQQGCGENLQGWASSKIYNLPAIKWAASRHSYASTIPRCFLLCWKTPWTSHQNTFFRVLTSQEAHNTPIDQPAELLGQS